MGKTRLVGCALAAAALQVQGHLSAQQAPAQTPTFRAEVTHVTTDVIPRDSSGRFIPDLAKDDCSIIEDGVVQTIDSFALVHGGRTFNTISAPPPASARRDHSADHASTSVGDHTGRVLLIFVDDLHFEAE